MKNMEKKKEITVEELNRNIENTRKNIMKVREEIKELMENMSVAV